MTSHIMMNFSTDDRAWLKRLLISWVILNVLGFITTYLVNITNGGSYVATPYSAPNTYRCAALLSSQSAVSSA